MQRAQILSEEQIHTIDRFVHKVLDAYKDGKVSKQDAALAIGHVIVAVDSGNQTEYVNFPVLWSE
ncbi:hypothetical protein RPSD_52240 (plasmid) [Ralstonia solanacearum]|nr:hypothetical protein RPSD_52240 [Ralstonia solanacearum]